MLLAGAAAELVVVLFFAGEDSVACVLVVSSTGLIVGDCVDGVAEDLVDFTEGFGDAVSERDW